MNNKIFIFCVALAVFCALMTLIVYQYHHCKLQEFQTTVTQYSKGCLRVNPDQIWDPFQCFQITLEGYKSANGRNLQLDAFNHMQIRAAYRDYLSAKRLQDYSFMLLFIWLTVTAMALFCKYLK